MYRWTAVVASLLPAPLLAAPAEPSTMPTTAENAAAAPAAPVSTMSSPQYYPAQRSLDWPGYYTPSETVDPRPRYLPYNPNEPIVSGYGLQTYYPRGYLIAGSITFGVGYGLGFMSAFTEQGNDFNAHWLLAPVVGPFIAMTTQSDTCVRGTIPPVCERHAATIVVLAVLGGMQVVGASLFTYGLTHPRQRLMRVDAPRVTVAPIPMGRGGYGLAAMGTF